MNARSSPQPRHWAWLAASSATYAATISLGAVVSQRLPSTGEGLSEALGFGLPQLVRYVVAAAIAVVVNETLQRRVIRSPIAFAIATCGWASRSHR